MENRLLLVLLASSLLLLGCAGYGGNSGGAPPLPPSSPSPSAPVPSASAPPVSAPSSSAAVTISGFAFGPPSLTVSKGSSVTFTNKDSVPHTVTSDTSAFDSGTLSSGASWSHVFDAPGTYEYHCNVHPGMNGTITVSG